ncbi:MAG TPA: hypothetical protein VEK38_00260 [Candidatus Bathyarchaeia archaeon]|nr:hypothetical protein [Candidatus Bathyarchaeia archaeon]
MKTYRIFLLAAISIFSTTTMAGEPMVTNEKPYQEQALFYYEDSFEDREYKANLLSFLCGICTSSALFATWFDINKSLVGIVGAGAVVLGIFSWRIQEKIKDNNLQKKILISSLYSAGLGMAAFPAIISYFTIIEKITLDSLPANIEA